MTDFLFAQPSFLKGMGRVADRHGQIDSYNTSPSGAVADERALRADWLAIGKDIADAMKALGCPASG